MEKQEAIRGFKWQNKAWYAEANRVTGKMLNINILDKPEIMVGLYCDNGNTSLGEFKIRWEEIDGSLYPRLMIYDDAWKALASMKDLIDELALYDDKHISDRDMTEVLLSLGFKDMTEYEKPKD